MAQTADYIIVGGGLAGCVLASRLSEKSPAKKVILLEAGPDEHENPLVQTPLACFTIHGTELEYNYETVPQKHVNGRKIKTYGGKVLSGSSSVNYGLWTRGDNIDYDEWAEAVGDSRWSYKSQLPYFKKTEHHYDESADPSIHGFDGPIHTVSGLAREYPLAETVRSSLVKTGTKQIPDANNGYPHGLAPYTENWYKGARQPAGVAYNLSKVQVLTNAIVKRVIVEQKTEGLTATGVELVDGRRFICQSEVIVACGALRTPQLLMVSGIGPAEELERHGITTILNAPDVGKHLHDHVVFPQYWRLRHPEKGLTSGAENFNKPAFLEGVPCDWILTESVAEPIMKKALEADGEVVGNDHPLLKPRGHYEALFAYAPAAAIQSENDIPFDGTHITTCVLMLMPNSRGSITLSSANVEDYPVIDPNYLSSEADRTILRQAVRRILRAIETDDWKEIIESETTPDGYPPLTTGSSDEDIDARVRRCACTWWHPAGTVSMGKVVDTQLRVKGIRGLRVVDASVFPVPIAAHYQVPTYALAEQAADIIG